MAYRKAFRISKTDLRIRPIYHRLAHRIQAHLIIAFCSYKLYKELERHLQEKKLNLSAEKAVEIMQSIFTVTTKLPFSRKSIQLIMSKTFEQQQLQNAFEVKFWLGGSNAENRTEPGAVFFLNQALQTVWSSGLDFTDIF